MKFMFNILFIMLFLLSCQSTHPLNKLANDEMSFFAKEVKRTNNLNLIGLGGGAPFKVITHFNLVFTSNDYYTIEEARFLYLDLCTRFIKRINENEKIREYLATYPITIDNFDLQIDFPESVDYVNGVGMGQIFENCSRDYIFYYGYDHNEKKFKVYYKELYSEAKELYDNSQDNKCDP